MNQYIVLGLAALAFVLLWWLKRPNVTSNEAHRLVKEERAQLVDVRSPAEFAAGHVDGARNIPVNEIAARARELSPSDRPIVLYCASGARSAMAARSLRGAGFSRVYNLGPMSSW
jgi:rhodanese-related sulfurtransferase